MNDSSVTVQLIFVASAAATLALFIRAVPHRRARVFVVLLVWTALQGVLAQSGIYADVGASPPRFPLAVAPPLLTLVALLVSRAGRQWLLQLDLRALIWLHVVRVPVEFGLHQLYSEGLIPEVMTWEGRNFDIISGLTAPLVAWLAFRRPTPARGLLIGWNVGALALLLIVVIHGVLSLPFPFQEFGFEQPNWALLYFPFNWLPAVIVPLVLVSHVAALLQLCRGRDARQDASEAEAGAPQ